MKEKVVDGRWCCGGEKLRRQILLCSKFILSVISPGLDGHLPTGWNLTLSFLEHL
jgi:hypothetical protein